MNLSLLVRRDAASELKFAVNAFLKACKGDFENLCAGKNGPDAVACLKSNEDKQSSECKQAVSKRMQAPGWYGRSATYEVGHL